MPFALITSADSGVRRKSTSAFAAAASLALAMMAAAKTMVFWRSPGSGPTTSMPATRHHFLDDVHADLGLAVCN